MEEAMTGRLRLQRLICKHVFAIGPVMVEP
jgi:hypothetical protein